MRAAPLGCKAQRGGDTGDDQQDAVFRAVGAVGEGSAPRLRLFCFPHGGGGARSFGDWAGSLPDGTALFAYAHPGRGERFTASAHTRLTDAAEEAATQLVERAAGAPYALFGHSVGALLAFETGRALERQGAPAPRLVGLSGHAAPERAFRAEQFAALSDEALFEEIRRLGGLPVVSAEEEESLRDLVLPPVRSDFLLAAAYLNELRAAASPWRLNAPLALFAGRSDVSAPPDEMEGWRAHGAGDCTAHAFEGGHFFTETARDDVIAAFLRAARFV